MILLNTDFCKTAAHRDLYARNNQKAVALNMVGVTIVHVLDKALAVVVKEKSVRKKHRNARKVSSMTEVAAHAECEFGNL